MKFVTSVSIQLLAVFSFNQVGAQKMSVAVKGLDHEIVNGSCPVTASVVQDLNGASDIILYSPYDRKDVVISYSSTGWSNDQIETILDNGFNMTLPTILLVHGTNQAANATWLEAIRNIYDIAFPVSSNSVPLYNLMFYNWGKYSSLSRAESYSYVPPMGRFLGEFLEKFGMNTSYDFDSLQLVGFSAGNHVIGSAAKLVAGTYALVGQVTALDASGPCFMDGSAFSRMYALTANDTKFLAAKHQNMFGVGSKYLLGDINILVNGGRNQPANKVNVWTGVYSASDLIAMVYANHQQSSAYESEDIYYGCDEMAYACDSYEHYLQGGCADCGSDGSKCYLFNDFKNYLYAPRNRYEERNISVYQDGTKFFLKTNYEQPYCFQQYQLVVTLNEDAPSSIRKLIADGLVELIIDDGRIVRLYGPSDGNRFTGLVSIGHKVEQLNTTSLLAHAPDSETSTFFRSLYQVELNYMSHYSAEGRARSSYLLCPDYDNQALVPCKS